ncbi:MAG: hypothetical protein UT39_C0002G0015 [Candidatus Woesebacteria bacterium GW2011_GWA1_39_21]|uniref:Glycosyltransferase RgtA/B/C/D-like domain-containing protein n=1 Tax=Candidatus Woesebacteria bacterium GW2011_GWA1_39_21 TaxID=1618550 RepID=A0A0G0N6N0_9BACT|nr:MAG: hypothetical protein UT39_C0002G0015 [Candidatus Woesebacteria bacterium GW2011_GWA1_39_21]
MKIITEISKKVDRFVPLKILGFILILFFITRITLVFSGLVSRNVFTSVYENWYEWKIAKTQWLDLWSVWDSAWYLDVAQNGYSTEPSQLPKACCNQTNTAFFPLYPVSVGLLGRVINNYYLAGLLLSNISLIFSAIYLYKLALLTFNEKVAKQSLLFLFLFPTAFVLSGIFSESLFLLLTILCFYFARKNNWALCGFSGFLLSLTRPTGVFCLLPIAYLYIKQNGFKIHKNSIYLFLYAAGLILFSTYLYFLTGNPLAFSHAPWGAVFSNPLIVLYELLSTTEATMVIGIFTILEIILLLHAYLKSNVLEYLMLSLIVVGIPLVNGVEIAIGIPRMSAAVFPLFLALALVAENSISKKLLTIFLIPIQVVFMMAWSIGILII